MSHRNSVLPVTPGSLPTARTHAHTRQPSRNCHVGRGPDRIPGQGTPEAELQSPPWGGCLSDWLPEKMGGTGQEASLQGSRWRHHPNQATGPASRDVARTAGTATREKRATSPPGCAFQTPRPSVAPRTHAGQAPSDGHCTKHPSSLKRSRPRETGATEPTTARRGPAGRGVSGLVCQPLGVGWAGPSLPLLSSPWRAGRLLS